MTPEEFAAGIRAAVAQFPTVPAAAEVQALTYIGSAHRSTYLSADERLAQIGAVLAALDIVSGDAVRELAATVAEIKDGGAR